MRYLGMEFKDHAELKAWSKVGHIEHYKKLSAMFAENPSMELIDMMWEEREVLVKQFNMTYEECELLEIA